MSDPEVEAIRKIQETLGALEPDAAKRVVLWAQGKFGDRTVSSAIESERGAGSVAPDSEFEDIADLFDAVSPKTEADKALTVGYWLQIHEDASVFEGFRVNTELKNLGHGLSNVTRALNELINRVPALVIQTRKSGPSKQARKQYKLTREGRRHVEARIGVDSAVE